MLTTDIILRHSYHR